MALQSKSVAGTCLNVHKGTLLDVVPLRGHVADKATLCPAMGASDKKAFNNVGASNLNFHVLNSHTRTCVHPVHCQQSRKALRPTLYIQSLAPSAQNHETLNP